MDRKSSKLGDLKKVFLVTIHYREPTYEKKMGRGPKSYKWTFSIKAQDEETAKSKAVAEFKQTTALSWVGWGREVIEVECKEVEL